MCSAAVRFLCAGVPGSLRRGGLMNTDSAQAHMLARVPGGLSCHFTAFGWYPTPLAKLEITRAHADVSAISIFFLPSLFSPAVHPWAVLPLSPKCFLKSVKRASFSGATTRSCFSWSIMRILPAGERGGDVHFVLRLMCVQIHRIGRRNLGSGLSQRSAFASGEQRGIGVQTPTKEACNSARDYEYEIDDNGWYQHTLWLIFFFLLERNMKGGLSFAQHHLCQTDDPVQGTSLSSYLMAIQYGCVM